MFLVIKNGNKLGKMEAKGCASKKYVTPRRQMEGNQTRRVSGMPSFAGGMGIIITQEQIMGNDIRQ
jgi:hypothetical protein